MGKKMPKGRRFEKGQSGNPAGRAAVPPEIRAIQNLTTKEVLEIGSLVVKGSLRDLQAIAKDPEATALKVMIAAVAVKTIQKGDASALDVLLNRLIGKVKDKVEITGDEGGPVIVGEEDTETRMARIAAKVKKLQILNE